MVVHLCDISCNLRKVVLSYFYPQLHINYQHSEIFSHLCRTRCCIVQLSGEHHGAMLTLQKAGAFWFEEAQTAFCRVPSHSEVQWAQRERQIPQELQCPAHSGCWALVCSGTWGPDLHGHHWQLSTQEFLRFCLNRCGKNAVLS